MHRPSVLCLIFAVATTGLRLPIPGGLRRRENALLQSARSTTADGSALSVLEQFVALEKAAPPPSDLLENARSSAALDGRWELVATIAGEQVGASSEELAATGVVGVVNASGISVKAGGAIQQIDVTAGRISNEVAVEPLGVPLFVPAGPLLCASSRKNRSRASETLGFEY